VNTPAQAAVGTIDLIDLDIVSRFYGRDFLPFPFQLTKFTDFTGDYDQRERVVLDRFHNGDLRGIQDWAATYVRADVRVEAHVNALTSDAADVRVVAHRYGEQGYFAHQRRDGDVIEISSLSAYDLGPAVAAAMELSRPGRDASIVIPEYSAKGRQSPSEDDEAFSVRESTGRDDAVVKRARHEVTAIATVQSHWRPTRRWGVDRNKSAVVWVRLAGDGDYAYLPDFSAAQPLTKATLVERVNRLIAEDVATVRQFRRGT
jgi:hypothetical protein